MAGRLFAKIDLDYADHPKIERLSDAAFRAHVSMILYARKYLTDGIIPARYAKRFGFDALSELLTNDEATPSLAVTEAGDYLLHGFLDLQESKAKVAERSQVNAENGKRGGRPPKTQSLSESVSETKAETETETETDRKKNSSAPAVRVSESDFESAWAHWPKKVERKKSFEKFKAAAKTRGVAELVTDIIRFGDAYARTTERQYTPALNVWLNGERWTDDLPTASTDVINAQWDAAVADHRPDPCASGHKWAADGSCVRYPCTAVRSE